MPEQYVAMRDSFKKKGMSDKKAKAKAAAIYNSKHHDNPVGRYSEDFCQFMEARWEKPAQKDKDKAYARYGKTKYSTSQKNTKTAYHKQAEIDKLKFSAPRNPSWDMDPRRVTDLLKQDVHEDTSGLVGGGGNEGNEQGVAGAATSSKTLKSPKTPEKVIKKPEEIKPVDTTMKEEFCKFMEDRGERLHQDAKHSGKYEKPRGEGSHRSLKTYPPDMKRVHAWAGDSRLKNSKHVRHGYRQSVKRDIAKDPENV